MSTRQTRTADKATNDKHTRILKKLLQRPENRFCVDCRKKDPRWASFNLGCFMCIQCSGVHRSMGTHISKVKSVDLDSWTPEQVENMIKWGNERANMYWEAELPSNRIPTENTSMDPWIRAKYDRKAYTGRAPFPDPFRLKPLEEDEEAMSVELFGPSSPQVKRQAQMSRTAGSSTSFPSPISPPPSNPIRSSATTKPSSDLQGADLFSIGRPSAPATVNQVDFFGLSDPVPAPAPTRAAQPAMPAANSAMQDLFSMTSPATTPSAQSPAATPAQAKAPNTDWKNSIMSLYGNQSSAPNPNQGGFGAAQQPLAPFGQLQGLDAFGFGQAPSQQQQQQSRQQQQQQQQQNPWGNDDAFGAMQQASGPGSSGSSFDAFSMGSNNNMNNNNGFGARPTSIGSSFDAFSMNSNNNSNNNGFGAAHMGGNSGFGNPGVPQGGDFFNMIAGAAKSPTMAPKKANESNSAFGDLTWN
ncbi:hypothetical protein BGZ98_008126 [Dissophora globulifera]|nr:hypothetical protein BGZ98_008126 [Dissophora globulifera]